MRADAGTEWVMAGGFSVEMKVQWGGAAKREWGFGNGDTRNVKLSGDIGENNTCIPDVPKTELTINTYVRQITTAMHIYCIIDKRQITSYMFIYFNSIHSSKKPIRLNKTTYTNLRKSLELWKISRWVIQFSSGTIHKLMSHNHLP